MTEASPSVHNDADVASAFWDAFTDAEPSWRTMTVREQVEAMNELAARFHPGVALELSGQDSDPVLDLCVTAHGDIEVFPLVMEVVRQDPALPRYRVSAFRARMARPDFAIVMGDFTLSASEILVRQWPDGAYVGMEIRPTRDIPDTLEDRAPQMAFIMLDHVIGEYDLAVKVGTVEWTPFPPEHRDSFVTLDAFPPLFDAFWTNELGHTGLFPQHSGREDDGDWSVLEIAPDGEDGETGPEYTTVVMLNNAAMSLAMRADLSYALTVAMSASDDDELEHAQEKQEQIGAMLEQKRWGILAYTLFKCDERSAVYYVSDAEEARALVVRTLEPGTYELSGEHDFGWGKYCYYATA